MIYFIFNILNYSHINLLLCFIVHYIPFLSCLARVPSNPVGSGIPRWGPTTSVNTAPYRTYADLIDNGFVVNNNNENFGVWQGNNRQRNWANYLDRYTHRHDVGISYRFAANGEGY